MKEKWKLIKDYEEYAVSDQGRVAKLKTRKILMSHVDHKGYLRVGLSKCGKKKNFKIHRLVAEAFLPNPFNLPEVDHIFNDRKDNRAKYLRWISKSMNTRNTKRCKESSSKYNGVSFHKQTGKWKASAYFEQKNEYIGLFETEESAAIAFNKFCTENCLDRELNITAEV